MHAYKSNNHDSLLEMTMNKKNLEEKINAPR